MPPKACSNYKGPYIRPTRTLRTSGNIGTFMIGAEYTVGGKGKRMMIQGLQPDSILHVRVPYYELLKWVYNSYDFSLEPK